MDRSIDDGSIGGWMRADACAARRMNNNDNDNEQRAAGLSLGLRPRRQAHTRWHTNREMLLSSMGCSVGWLCRSWALGHSVWELRL